MAGMNTEGENMVAIYLDFTEEQIDHIEHLLAQVTNQEERVA